MKKMYLFALIVLLMGLIAGSRHPQRRRLQRRRQVKPRQPPRQQQMLQHPLPIRPPMPTRRS